MNTERIDFFREGDNIFLEHISVDCVVFGISEATLKVLAVKWINNWPWALPAGFVRHHETLDVAAARALMERVGLSADNLTQFHVFGDPQREKGKEQFLNPERPSWIDGRFVSISFYGVVNISASELQVEDMFERAEWFELGSLPNLLFDHSAIVDAALTALRDSLYLRPFGWGLLAESFTLTELRQLYETVLGRTLEADHFEPWILAAGHLVPAAVQNCYRFDELKYHNTVIRPI